MKTPECTTAKVFPRYVGGEVLADSTTFWPGLFVRRYRFPRVVDGFLVPATTEPLMTLAWAELLSAGTAGKAKRIAALTPSGDSHRRKIHKRRIAET
jgi:hypothetical protein